MGTNYYATRVKCEACGKTEKLHIGKSSAGWCFGLHVWEDDSWHETGGPSNFEQWVIMLAGSEWTIVSKYDDEISLGGLIRVISSRKSVKSLFGAIAFDFEANSAVPGPNGLARASISKGHCIAHGAGTWDLIVGEFS